MGTVININPPKTYKAFHLYCGIGGGALGFKNAVNEYRGMVGRFRNIGGIDVDPLACENYEMLTESKATKLDLFSRADYTAFHGHEPPSDWREATPEDILEAAGGEYPDVVFLSPPCKGFSGLLPSKAALSEKYQALNRLTHRGVKLMLEAFKDDLPGLVLLENVPRITTRGAEFLVKIKRLLKKHGYLFHEGYHDCGEVGGLGQHRRRYLLIARNPEKVQSFVYQPPKRRVKSIGEVIGPLPLPDDPAGGPMHVLPNLQWKTWLRLALIEAGSDWRCLENIAPEQYRLEYIPRGGGCYGVQDWNKPSSTVTGSGSVKGSTAVSLADPRVDQYKNTYRVADWNEAAGTVTGQHAPSNGAICMADIRLGHNPWQGVFRIHKFDEPSSTVTGSARPNTSNGFSCISDPRLKERDSRHPAVYRVVKMDKTAPCITGTRFGSRAPAIADSRITQSEILSIDNLRLKKNKGRFSNKFHINSFKNPACTVTGIADIQAGALSIADPRLSKRKNRRSNSYLVRPWDGQAYTITGEDSLGSGAQSIADPRLGCRCRNGSYGVQAFDKPGNTVTASGDIHSGSVAIADPRIPKDNEQGRWIIIAPDGTWHRPTSVWENFALQGFPLFKEDGSPIVLAGKSAAVWREHIGNAVPPPAAEGIAEQMLFTLLVNEFGDFVLSETDIWVAPENCEDIPLHTYDMVK